MGVLPCLKNDRPYSVATASNIPTEKSEKFISQTIEKLLDGIIPMEKKKEYTIVLLATPIQDVEQRKLKLGEFYSGMAPYSSWQTNYTYTENKSVGSSATVGVNVGASAGIQNGQNYGTVQSESNTVNESKTDTESENDSLSYGDAIADSSSESHMEGSNSSETATQGTNESSGGGSSETSTISAGTTIGPQGLGLQANVSASKSLDSSMNYSRGTSSSLAETLGKSASDTLTKGITHTVSETVAKATGTAVANTLGKAVTKAMAVTSGVTKGTNLGANFGANFARSSTVTAMIGKNEGITQNFTNYNIKHALELLENQMKRLEQSTALGMWDFAAYILSEEYDVANNVAHAYLALTLGEESYMSKAAINVWKGNVEEEKDCAKEIVDYIRELRHPIFSLKHDIIKEDRAYCVYPSIVTATTSLSGKELSYSLNFPQKSIAGLPVLECAEFGRNVVTYDTDENLGEELELGSIFHMNHVENNRVSLAKKSLASHTFITGSTGSGKSNTIYQILEKARKKGVKF